MSSVQFFTSSANLSGESQVNRAAYQDTRGRWHPTTETRQALVHEALARPALDGERVWSGVLAGVSCTFTRSQRDWYHAELNRLTAQARRAARQAVGA